MLAAALINRENQQNQKTIHDRKGKRFLPHHSLPSSQNLSIPEFYQSEKHHYYITQNFRKIDNYFPPISKAKL